MPFRPTCKGHKVDPLKLYEDLIYNVRSFNALGKMTGVDLEAPDLTPMYSMEHKASWQPSCHQKFNNTKITILTVEAEKGF